MKMKRTFSILVLFTLSITLLYAQDDFSVKARWENGTCSGAAVAGNIAFIGNGSNLTSLNISDPENPVVLSDVLVGGQVTDVFAAGNYAYLAINTLGLGVVDISDPANMILLYTHTSYNFPSSRVCYADGYAYVVDSGGILIFDVSNPENPEYIYQIFADGITEVCVENGFAYLSSKNSGLIIYNVEDPSQPFPVGVLGGNYWGNSIALDGTTVFLGTTQGLKMIDVSDKTSPLEIGSMEGNIKDLYHYNGIVFSLLNYAGVQMIDVSNPANPVVIGELDAINIGFPECITASENLFFLCDDGFQIYDASNPPQINKLSSYVTGSYIANIKVINNYAYLTDFSCGLFIMDVTAKTDITKISQVIPGIPNNNFRASAISGDLLCLGSFYGVYFIDISDPYNPEIISELPTGGINDLEIIGDYLYILFQNSISILDISNLNNIHEIKVLEGNATDIFVKDNYAYVVTNFEDSVTIIDISNPTDPQIISVWDVQDIYFARDIFVSGNYAYTCGHGLNITDISDPNNPEVVGVLLGDYWYSVAVNGENAYIGSEDGVKRIDISDKENPVLTGQFDSPYTYTGEIAFSEDLIYFAQAWNGLYLLEDNFPTGVNEIIKPLQFELKQNYPNPFNPSTTIDYSISKSEVVKLTVYNLLGQKVKVILDEYQNAGSYSVKFNAEGLVSGIYFYRLTSGNYSESRKLILLK